MRVQRFGLSTPPSVLWLPRPQSRKVIVVEHRAAFTHDHAHPPLGEFNKVAATGALIALAKIDVVYRKAWMGQVEPKHIAQGMGAHKISNARRHSIVHI